MSVTDEFVAKGLTITTEVSDNRFKMIDSGAIEIETGELVYGLVRRLKPKQCLSTGIYTGISDLYIAKALQDNGSGSLTALEIDTFHIQRAKELWNKVGVSEYIIPVHISSLDYISTGEYQFLFLDSEPSIRLNELVRFYPFVSPRGFIMVHDLPPDQCRGNVNTDHPDFPNWPIGEIPKEFDELIKTRKLLPSYFPDARSLSIFYKPTERDFI